MMNFKKKFNDKAINEMIYLFSNWEKRNLTITHGKREKAISDTYGFPYTSSGNFAGIWNTNVEARLRKESEWKFDGLVLTEEWQMIAIFTNDEEKERFEIIGKVLPTE